MASHLEGEDYELPVAGGSTHQTTLGRLKVKRCKPDGTWGIPGDDGWHLMYL